LNIEVVRPDNNILNKFSEMVNPIMKKTLDNLYQIQSISKARDELLPRLMSGKVRVNNFNDK